MHENDPRFGKQRTPEAPSLMVHPFASTQTSHRKDNA